MTPEFKAKWLEALRGGKYRQARTALKNNSGAMCCLGVACDLIDASAWNQERDDRGGFGWRGCGTKDIHVAAEAIGISQGLAKDLAYRNDGTADYKPHTFAEIADYIERHL